MGYKKIKTLKHILEYQNYSDEDLRDLLGSLEGVGQSTVARASVWVEYVIRSSGNQFAIRKMLTTDPFYVTGNEEVDSDLALKTIAEGKFVDDSVHHEREPKAYRVQTFQKEKIQQMAKETLEEKDEEGSPLERFGSRLAVESVKAYNAKHPETTYLRVDFSIFITPPGDPVHNDDEFYTLPSPMNEVVYRIK